MKVGTTLWGWREANSAQTLCAQAERAEAMGLHSIWLPENHFSGAGAIPSPLTLLAAIAARTRRIKLGCTSYLLPIRQPLQAAEEVAVLDQLSEGRLILGLGRGIQNSLFAAFDIATGNKRKLFDTNLKIMRSAWRGEPVGYDGNKQPIVLAPLPVQQPSPPLWVAAFGPLALQQVAELGLPYLASPLESLDVLEQNYTRYHQLLEEANMPAVTTIPIMRSVLICQNPSVVRELRAALDKAVPAAMRDKAGEIEDWALVGDAAYVQDKLAEYQARLQVSHLILRAGMPGIDENEQLASHARVLEIAASL